MFDGNGFAITTTNKIAKLAGVSIGSLYRYFPNKRVILGELISRAMDQNHHQFIGELMARRNLPLAKAVEEIVDLSIESFLNHKGFYKVFFEQVYSLNLMEEVVRKRQEFAKTMAQVLAEDFTDQVRVDDLEINLFVAFNSYISILEAYCVGETPPIEKEKVKRELKNLITGYISRA